MTSSGRSATRVAALIDTYQVSGPGRQLAAVAVALRDHGVTMRVVLFHRHGRPPAPYAAYLADAGVDHVVVTEHGPADVGLFRRVAAALGTFDPDVVQTHGYKPSAVASFLRLTRRPRWRWLAFFHGSTTENAKVRAYHWLDRQMMSRADLLAVMSSLHRAEFARLGGRVRIVYNAAIALPRPEDAPSVDVHGAFDAPRAPDTATIGVVGRLSSEKGVDIFLDACTRLVADGVRFRAVIVGDGPEREALVSQRTRLGLTDRVAFTGAVRDVGHVYEQLDCLVIPSRSEGLPNVLLEALRHDRPVVSTRVGAVPDVLTDPRAGVLVPVGDADALAAGIVRGLALARDPEATTARAATVQRFSLAARAEVHVALYTELTTVARSSTARVA